MSNPLLVYFDSTVFLSVITADKCADDVKKLLVELQAAKARIYTSIVSIQEVSVDSFRRGTVAVDNHARVKKLARVEGITRDIAITAAKIEAQVIDGYGSAADKKADNKRRKWDCFHIATAQCLKCEHLYSFDDGMLCKQKSLDVRHTKFLRPQPLNRDLFSDL